MATPAVYVKSSSLVTSNPNLYASSFERSRSRTSSRKSTAADDHAKVRAFLTPSQNSSRKTSSQVPASHQPPQSKEEDLETILDLAPEIAPYDETGKRTYEKACERLGVVPASTVMNSLGNSKTIDCKHYGLGPSGTMAVALALVVNTRVTTVNLQGNDIGMTGMAFMQKMISENYTITELNISDNKIGSFGARAVQKMLKDNRTLMRLEMAGNDFSDADASLLAKAIQEHPELRIVDLSHNNFGDISGPLFEDMISECPSLQNLDLSWNLFRIKGAIHIAKGLKENASLKTFNFSWNGFGDEGARAFGKALKVNNVLSTLNLMSCRIGPEGFMQIIAALALNESLLHLQIGKNNIPEEVAASAVSLIRSYPAVKLETLDMTDCTFSPQFEDKVKTLNEMHRHLTVVYGYSDNFGKGEKLDLKKIVEEGMVILKDYCKENNVTLVELFTKFDTDNSMTVSLQEFQEGLKEAKVPMSLYKIEQFASALDQDGDGEVDYSEMVFQFRS